jgi:hypothetical protein
MEILLVMYYTVLYRVGNAHFGCQVTGKLERPWMEAVEET